MGKFINRLQFLVMLSGITALGLNLANPKIAQESKKTLSQALGAVTETAKATVLVEDESAAQKTASEDGYVWIDGKSYPFNPRHVYNVNGVPTFYKKGQPKSLTTGRTPSDEVDENKKIQKAVAPGVRTAEMDQLNKDVLDAVSAAKKHVKMLEELDKQ